MTRTFLFFCLAASMVLLVPAGARALGIGDKAPFFTAPSDKGEVSLENYLGQKIRDPVFLLRHQYIGLKEHGTGFKKRP